MSLKETLPTISEHLPIITKVEIKTKSLGIKDIKQLCTKPIK